MYIFLFIVLDNTSVRTVELGFQLCFGVGKGTPLLSEDYEEPDFKSELTATLQMRLYEHVLQLRYNKRSHAFVYSNGRTDGLKGNKRNEVVRRSVATAK